MDYMKTIFITSETYILYIKNLYLFKVPPIMLKHSDFCTCFPVLAAFYNFDTFHF